VAADGSQSHVPRVREGRRARRQFWAALVLLALLATSPLAIERELVGPSAVCVAVVGWLASVITVLMLPWLLVPIALARTPILIGDDGLEATTAFGPRSVGPLDSARLSAYSVPTGNRVMVYLVIHSREGRIAFESTLPFVSFPDGLTEILMSAFPADDDRMSARANYYLRRETAPLRVQLTLIAQTVGSTTLLFLIALALLLPYRHWFH
jgi:hypothetical protein